MKSEFAGWIDRRRSGADAPRQVRVLQCQPEFALPAGVEVRSFLLLHPDLRVVDVVIVCESEEGFVVPEFFDDAQIWGAVGKKIKTGSDNLIPSMDSFCNSVVLEAGALLDEPLSNFGVVTTERYRGKIGDGACVGIVDQDFVAPTRNSLRIFAAEPDIGDRLFGYLAYAAFAVRTRHLAVRLDRQLHEVLAAPLGNHWGLMNRVASLQRSALVTRAALRPGQFLGKPRLIELARSTGSIVVMHDDEYDFINSVPDQLQGYASTNFAVAVDSTQSRFTRYGVVFAAMGFMYSLGAAFDFAGRTGSEWTVFLSLNFAALTILLCLVFLWANRSQRT